jgi:glycosyltransferase involved in cell wall biosynthesis
VWMPDIGFGTKRPWHRWLVRHVLHRADLVTAVSTPMVEMIRRAGAEAVRVTLGVDTRTWAPEPPRPRAVGAARLVHVGSLTPVKDQPTVIRAVALLAKDGVPVHLDLVGEDAWNGVLQRHAAEQGVSDRVTFHGFRTQRETVPIVRAADLMIVSSRHEAGPVALLEAAAVGVPSVGTAVGHLVDWAPHAAVVVPPGDAVALAREIALLLAEDADWTCARIEELYHQVAQRD